MAPAGGFDWMTLLPIFMIFVIFYFFLIRPQQKKLKEHQEMLQAIRRGDKIVTNGGLIGTVTKLTSEEELLVEISENVRVRIMRGMISSVLARSEPTKAPEKKTPKSKTPPQS